LETEGYTVAPSGASPQQLAAAQGVIRHYVASRGVEAVAVENGVVPLHQPQAFWDLRQLPGLHALFAGLLGTERLWVSMDRASFKPGGRRLANESQLHWDLNPREWLGRLHLQGVLCLTDTAAGQGGFECSPGLFRALPEYLARHPTAGKAGAYDGERVKGSWPTVAVEAKAGDIIVWSSLLPHRSGPNRSDRDRLAVYITYFPEGSESERRERIANWSERRAPAWWRKWPVKNAPEPGPPAELTPLGKKLLGLERWEG
jgi:hypothetical protein